MAAQAQAMKQQKQIKVQKKVRNQIDDQEEEWLIGPQRKQDAGRKTLVLDLDETLVHSQFKPVDNADIVLPVEIEG